MTDGAAATALADLRRSSARRTAEAGRLRSFLRFFGGSAAGLAIDLGGFTALSLAGAAPAVANLCSSFVSISVVYVLVTRYAFGSGTSVRSYVAFVAWYSASILVFSTVIAVVSGATGLVPLAVKLGTVPVSFAANYWFSRRLLSRTRR